MKLFVWDFHGVLEKGNEIATIEVSNQVLENLNYKERFSVEDINMLYGLKWFEYFQYLLPNESLEKHMELQERCFANSNNSKIIKKYIKRNDYSSLVLKKIREKHTQILISNTRMESIDFFTKIVGIEKYFHDIFAADAHSKNQKTTKVSILKEFLKDNNFEEIVIIGDSPGDMELVKVGGGKTYLYCHPGRNFKECEAMFKIQDLREVLREI